MIKILWFTHFFYFQKSCFEAIDSATNVPAKVGTNSKRFRTSIYRIVVPPGYKTRAELIITEDEYYGKFQVETIFEGSISVKLRDKKDGSVVSVVVINDLSKLLTAKNGFHPIPNSTSAVCFVNEGFCHCHYGIGQRVELQEEKI
ncbi:unnamed protein product [Schistosoma margrebowiei]|uniref:Uncharacterized protein n=1 Tax=Schistosoma margrebowiei TaxID=48269 RepID=A0A183M926_9TREM|nr:unnamed protein product [Schistosoma margrebowiei]